MGGGSVVGGDPNDPLESARSRPRPDWSPAAQWGGLSLSVAEQLRAVSLADDSSLGVGSKFLPLTLSLAMPVRAKCSLCGRRSLCGLAMLTRRATRPQENQFTRLIEDHGLPINSGNDLRCNTEAILNFFIQVNATTKVSAEPLPPSKPARLTSPALSTPLSATQEGEEARARRRACWAAAARLQGDLAAWVHAPQARPA
jgi:hypothetical protein